MPESAVEVDLKESCDKYNDLLLQVCIGGLPKFDIQIGNAVWLRSGEVVSDIQIVDIAWGDHDPSTRLDRKTK